MDTPAVASQSVDMDTENSGIIDQASTLSTWSTPEHTPHPQAAEILRQVDFYFSDDNLCHDAHLLGLIKEGKGSVSLNEVIGFRRMRRYKPKSAVREVIRQSTIVEITEDNKRIRLKRPPKKPLTVLPKINNDRNKIVVPEDKPWLSKGLLRATGFEQYVTEGPVVPSEHEEDAREYDPDNAFTDRIETAIRKFASKRKMHEETRRIFDKFMAFGGMDCGQCQFTGGLDNKTMEETSKKEIADATVYYGVSERVLDGLYDGGDKGEPTWSVDFEATTKGFLSSHFLTFANWYDEMQIKTACNVLRNFYNYLLLHDVCTEYNAQLLAARKICDIAEAELPKLSWVDRRLPGGFNSACSTLSEGNYANLHAVISDWTMVDDNMGWTIEQAEKVVLIGLFAHGTEDQLAKVEAFTQSRSSLKDTIIVISEQKMGLEVTRVDLANGEAKELYDDARLTDTYIHSMGKLRCKRWTVPHAKPVDLPEWASKTTEGEEFEILIEDETLKYCYPGLKVEACVKESNLGIKFIDYFETTYASFFTWLPNERVREWKEPGPPKQWMERRNAADNGQEVVIRGNLDEEDESGDDDEMPD